MIENVKYFTDKSHHEYILYINLFIIILFSESHIQDSSIIGESSVPVPVSRVAASESVLPRIQNKFKRNQEK